MKAEEIIWKQKMQKQMQESSWWRSKHMLLCIWWGKRWIIKDHRQWKSDFWPCEHAYVVFFMLDTVEYSAQTAKKMPILMRMLPPVAAVQSQTHLASWEPVLKPSTVWLTSPEQAIQNTVYCRNVWQHIIRSFHSPIADIICVLT